MSYQVIELGEQDRASAYKLFVTAIVPRPIGWISSLSKEGIQNAAPFSWFNAVCGDPLMVMGPTTGVVHVCPRGIRRDGVRVERAGRGVVTFEVGDKVREGDKVYVRVPRDGKRAGE